MLFYTNLFIFLQSMFQYNPFISLLCPSITNAFLLPLTVQPVL